MKRDADDTGLGLSSRRCTMDSCIFLAHLRGQKNGPNRRAILQIARFGYFSLSHREESGNDRSSRRALRRRRLIGIRLETSADQNDG